MKTFARASSRAISVAALAAIVTTPIAAQEQLAAATPQAAAVQPAPVLQAQLPGQPNGMAELPANTKIVLEMNQDVTTKGKTWKEGDQFNLSVADDVKLGNYIVIPRGTRGVGKITWLTDKGMFGKSGKMDVELTHLEMNGTRIPIDGTYRQEGEGNTLATVGGVLLAGVFAGFITGKSGLIPKGRELEATTEIALPVNVPASAIAPVQTALPTMTQPGPVAQPVSAEQ